MFQSARNHIIVATKQFLFRLTEFNLTLELMCHPPKGGREGGERNIMSKSRARVGQNYCFFEVKRVAPEVPVNLATPPYSTLKLR